MSFAAPLFAWVGGGLALGVVALHLLAWRRPPASPLPTARFAPDAPVRTVSRAMRPVDLGLLAVRVLVIVLVSTALAGPRFASRVQGLGRVIVVDRSHGPEAWTPIVRAARSMYRSGDALVLFDSTARDIRNPTVDSIVASSPMTKSAGLSAALVVGIRAANALQRVRDSVEIVVVSPFASDALDAATASIRRVWPGPVHTMRAGRPPNDTARPRPPDIRAGSSDPVSAALALAGAAPPGAVRVVRDSTTAADSAWARQGGAVVVWPTGAAHPGWHVRATADTAFGVTAISIGSGSSGSPAHSATVVAPFVRRVEAPPGRVVARWDDGEPAATEIPLGAGCVRSVVVRVPSTGDLALTPAFRRFAAQIAGSCMGSHGWIAASDSVVSTVLTATGARAAAQTLSMVDTTRADSTIAVWLLGAAMVAALAELLVRRGVANATA
jgi:aerotolerance regulator-like protein